MGEESDRYCVNCGEDLGRVYSPPIRCDSCWTADALQPKIDELTRERDAARAELDKVRQLIPPSGDLITESMIALRVQAELAAWTVETLEQRRRAEKAEAEVERLTAEVKGLTFCAETYKERAEKAEAEVERLTAEVKSLTADVSEKLRQRDLAFADSLTLRTEVERLTGLVTTATVEAAKAQEEVDRLRGEAHDYLEALREKVGDYLHAQWHGGDNYAGDLLGLLGDTRASARGPVVS